MEHSISNFSALTTAVPPQTISPESMETAVVTSAIPVDNSFTSAEIFLIALEDNGQSGQMIGCNDSVVPVEIAIEPTHAPLTAALEQLLHPESEYYGLQCLLSI
ncbi:MAG: hypothetical protein M5U34_34180 [Chloroflexi bacterium]|nr:hypothetical protein [Chloroflexota bacterium]